MADLVVFVSSILDRAKDDLFAEREAARNAIEELQLTRPWRFEDTPASSLKVDFSYLNKVVLADIFILILGKEVTAPVRREYEVAAEAGKPRLIFLKKGERAQDLEDFVAKIDVKWKSFSDTAVLKKEIVAALAQELVEGYRGQKIDLTAGDVKTLEGLQPKAPDSAGQSGGVSLGAGARASGPIAGRDLRIAGRDYNEARDNARITVTNNSAMQDVIELFDAMSAALEELPIPPHAKRQAKHAIAGARLEAESDTPDKERAADRLKEAATIIKNTGNLAVEATRFGALLVKGLTWVGKTVGWLAI